MRYSDQALNRLRVMQAISSRGPISRTELTGLLQLSSATITEVTADVVRRGLVRERKESSKRGRPRIQLEVNPDGGIVVGTSFSANGYLHITFVNLASDTLFEHRELLRNERSLPGLAGEITDGLKAAIAASAIPPDRISRIAVGLPGLIDRDDGVVHWMATMNDPPYAFRQHIESQLGRPVTVESSSVGMARSEYWFGRGREHASFLLVNVDRTVVATLVADGLPAAGSHGFNMEFPHIKVASTQRGRACYCGARGCVAAYASIVGILAGLNEMDANKDISATVPSASGLSRFQDIIRQARSGDPECRAQFEIAGEKLGVAVGNYVNACDPGHILVVSSERLMLDLMEPAFRTSIKAVTLPELERQTTIEIAVAAPSWRERGMAALALEQLFLSI